MDNEKDLLIASAARLYSMGIDLEAARDRLRQLVEQGVPYHSDEMKQAVQDFKELDRQWKALEKQHLELRVKVMVKDL
jgi:Arc/MetJ family transcription regulator